MLTPDVVGGSPTPESASRADSGGEFTEVRWVCLAEAGELMSGMPGLVHGHLQRVLGLRHGVVMAAVRREGVSRRLPGFL